MPCHVCFPLTMVWELHWCLSSALGAHKAKEALNDETNAAVPTPRWPRSILMLERPWLCSGGDRDLHPFHWNQHLQHYVHCWMLLWISHTHLWLCPMKIGCLSHSSKGFCSFSLPLHRFSRSPFVDFHHTFSTKSQKFLFTSFFFSCPLLPIFFSHSFLGSHCALHGFKALLGDFMLQVHCWLPWTRQQLSNSPLQRSWHPVVAKRLSLRMASPSRQLLRHQSTKSVLLVVLRAIACRGFGGDGVCGGGFFVVFFGEVCLFVLCFFLM